MTHMGVSKNIGTPKSSILIGFSIIFTRFSPYFGSTPISSISFISKEEDFGLAEDLSLWRDAWNASRTVDVGGDLQIL